MRILWIFALLFMPVTAGLTQTLSLSACYELAEANYPMIKRRGLIAQSASLSLENASRGWLPQAILGGQATYQSEVTRIPIALPDMEPLSKDQYRVFGEITQKLYDGGTIQAQREVLKAQSAVERESLETELYSLRARVNELFFGIMFMEASERQYGLVKTQLAAALEDVSAAIASGVALETDADIVRAEMLATEQRIISARASAQTYRNMLSALIGNEVTAQTELVAPVFESSDDIHRPELRRFEAQRFELEAQRRALTSRTRPQLELFVQGGYGRPGLNMLENDFTTWYLGGIRLRWSFSALYTRKNDAELISLRRKAVDSQEETFRLNTRLAAERESGEITKYLQLIEVDREIVRLREAAQEVASTRLREGVLSSADYVREVVAADQARQQLVLHEIQLSMSQARQQFETGIQ